MRNMHTLNTYAAKSFSEPISKHSGCAALQDEYR